VEEYIAFFFNVAPPPYKLFHYPPLLTFSQISMYYYLYPVFISQYLYLSEKATNILKAAVRKESAN